jgi:hypothetical protein
MITENDINQLENTYWCVPTKTLLAYEYVNKNYSPVSDQTVWYIRAVRNGYLMGECYAYINNTPTSKMNFIGSITPVGDVLFTFYSSNTSVNGTGKFVKTDEGNLFFIMQMNQLANLQGTVIGVNHWSYMRLVNPTVRRWYCLPGVGLSVPEFIRSFESLTTSS